MSFTLSIILEPKFIVGFKTTGTKYIVKHIVEITQPLRASESQAAQFSFDLSEYLSWNMLCAYHPFESVDS